MTLDVRREALEKSLIQMIKLHLHEPTMSWRCGVASFSWTRDEGCSAIRCVSCNEIFVIMMRTEFTNSIDPCTGPGLNRYNHRKLTTMAAS